MQVKCIKCQRIGNLTTKKTKTRGLTYVYYYVQHFVKETSKIEWCYLGLLDKLPQEYLKLLETTHKDYNYTQHIHKNNAELESLNLNSNSQKKQEYSSAPIAQWLEQRFRKP